MSKMQFDQMAGKRRLLDIPEQSKPTSVAKTTMAVNKANGDGDYSDVDEMDVDVPRASVVAIPRSGTAD